MIPGLEPSLGYSIAAVLHDPRAVGPVDGYLPAVGSIAIMRSLTEIPLVMARIPLVMLPVARPHPDAVGTDIDVDREGGHSA